MTDRDKIELPPLPPFVIAPIADEQTVRDYARAAVLADRARREQPPELVKPKVHSANLQLTARGNVKINPSVVDNVYACATITLRWTDDGRAWIESERNRELAQWLRSWRGQGGNEAANALDGGQR